MKELSPSPFQANDVRRTRLSSVREKIPTLLAYAAAAFIIGYAWTIGDRAEFPDTRAYYEAAHGNLSYTVTWKDGRTFVSGWVYVDVVRYLWYWMTLFPWGASAFLWFAVQAAALLYLTNRLIKEVGTYAWLILASLWWPISWFLSGSNISITLLACVLNPWLAAMACLVKPYLIVFLLLHLWVESRGLVNTQAA